MKDVERFALPNEFVISVELDGFPLVPQKVTAPNLVSALRSVAERPLTSWFPGDDERPPTAR